ncbi:PREDICTED: fibropellin-3-like [Branchiostoma belcheri]|uniref:Fibropellin-3-like n=1 Tax=Branchiostoma belcheri TaxID=7741 RepID=A0A6P4ZU58_BRABE|nr:PREDICTED: fibropellin-3-like [Branchiostoma belcheri]
MFRAVSGVILRPSFHRMMRSAVLSKTAQRHCCGIEGEWVNQHTSKVCLRTEEGTLRGEYITAVAEDDYGGVVEKTEPLVGFPPLKDSGTFGWVVNWLSDDGQETSTTTWTGQGTEEEDKYVLQTTWILRSEVKKADERWESTLVGEDTFIRPPKQDD